MKKGKGGGPAGRPARVPGGRPLTGLKILAHPRALRGRRRPALPAPGRAPVPSALTALASVFGMGTGIAPPELAPAPQGARKNKARKNISRGGPPARGGKGTALIRIRRYKQASRPISAGCLCMLPCLQLRPINPVVFRGPSVSSRTGETLSWDGFHA